MKKHKYIALCLAFAFTASSSLAFAGSPQTPKEIDYSIQLLVDGATDLPTRHQTIKNGEPIFLKSTIGENPFTGQQKHELTFYVKTTMTEKGLQLTGSFAGTVGSDVAENLTINEIAESGKVKEFSFEVDGRLYELVLKAHY